MQDTIEDLEWEIWKDIPGYEWYYMVSNIGRVKSLDRYVKHPILYRQFVKWILLKPDIYKSWYFSVTVRNNGSINKILVHRLVAFSFLWLDINSPTQEKWAIVVCHKDDNPSNNRVDNLFLWTQRENIIDMYSKWRDKCVRWEKHPMFWKKWKLHLWSKPVNQLTEDWKLIKEYASATEAAEILNLCNKGISACCRWKVAHCWWYKWEFAKGIER